MTKTMTSTSRSLLALAALALMGGGLVGGGCYTIDFDETLADVYYCESDADCGETQACSEFRCVDDSGPAVLVTGPESLQNFAFGTATVTANYTIQNFTISDSNERVEGEGKVLVSIAGTDISVESVIEAGAELDVSALAPGAYRVKVQAIYGDGEPYPNPSAIGYAPFYIEDENSARPQVAIVWPPPGHVHVRGEPLEVTVAARNFEFVETGTDCRIDEGCDPWGPDADACLPQDCELTPEGHSHVYMLDNYPSCLGASPTCNGDYVLSLRPTGMIESNGIQATGTIAASRFDEVGTFTFSATLQYNDHLPFPNTEFIVYDQITIEVR